MLHLSRRAALLLLLALALPGAAAATQPILEEGGAAGRQLYASYCAGCHGADGRGGEPGAPGLATPPPDLTRLYERYGTPLDRERVAAFIDGRLDVTAHGPREMPVWGVSFYADSPGPDEGVESARRRTIETLVDHLQTLQVYRQTRLR